MFDAVKDDTAVKEMVKMIFIEKQIDIAKEKKSKQYTCLWDLLPYDCQENVLSHKQEMEWGYLYREFGKCPMTTITRWLSANHVKVKLKAENTIPLLWSMINRKDLDYAIADYKLRSKWKWQNQQGERMKEKLIAVDNIGFQHKVYRDISLDSLKDYRREELAKNKAKRDAKRKAEEKKPQQPTLPVGTLIAVYLWDDQLVSEKYTFLIIRGETKTQYRVEKISNQTHTHEHLDGIGYGGYRDTTRCPKEGQTYEKHRNISKQMSVYELKQDYEDKGDYYEVVNERVWYD